jgi:uncharacterized protein
VRTRITKRPKLREPDLIACWPGIGNVGVITADVIRKQTGGEQLGYIEPWDFFYPKAVTIDQGELTALDFPLSHFYYSETEKRDLLFFIAGEQPSDGYSSYAQGEQAYKMANMVLDVAQKFGCKRVYTSGAAVTYMHHSARPRVWAVPNSKHLLEETDDWNNVVKVSELKEKEENIRITGMNGIMLGAARKRGIDGFCLMGEVPVYLQGLPFAYPKASKSVIEVLSYILNINIDYKRLDKLAARNQKEILRLYKHLPKATIELIDRLAKNAEPTDTGPITEKDKQQILDEIDKFFKPKP